MAFCALATEAGDKLITEAGEYLVYEPTEVCADADLPWEFLAAPGTEVAKPPREAVAPQGHERALEVVGQPGHRLAAFLESLPQLAEPAATPKVDIEAIRRAAAERAAAEALAAVLADDDEMLRLGLFNPPPLLWRIRQN